VLAGALESMSKDTRKPSKLWKFLNTDKKAENLVKLALRLFGIGINSASRRCFFSQAGIAHTKLRNRLSFEWSICTSWRANLSAILGHSQTPPQRIAKPHFPIFWRTQFQLQSGTQLRYMA